MPWWTICFGVSRPNRMASGRRIRPCDALTTAYAVTQTTKTRRMSEAIALKPTVVQQMLRHSQLARLLFPSPRKLDHFSTHHRAPYAGRPSRAVRRRIAVTRNDLDGRPVYE